MAGLYVHIPFCKQRCVYCDFYFVTSQKGKTDFVETLKEEIAYWGIFFGPNQPIHTIYFGGGTPSLLSPRQVYEVLTAIENAFDTSQVRERSFEINPDDVDSGYLSELATTGINRLSIGIQSFFDADLQWMNRAHSEEEAKSIVQGARQAGFDNLSIDLIFGLPEQSQSTWAKNLNQAISLEVPHISAYSLTVEPRTPLHKQIKLGRQKRVDDQTLATLFQYTIDTLRDNGYSQYEVSSYCKPGYRSQHNQSYWQHTNYLGVGPSAHSFWRLSNTLPSRWANAANLKRYLKWDRQGPPPFAFEETVSHVDMANEYIMLRLRTREGLNLETLEHAYGTVLKDEVVNPLISHEMAEITEGKMLRLTDQGLHVCDAITERLLQLATR